MEYIRRFLFASLLMMWGMNGSAFDYEGINYDVLSKSDKTVCVARQTATDELVGDVVIPSKVKYGGAVYTVTEISGWAFSSCNKMTSITIPATVQRIGYSAFYWCYGLKAVNVEDIAAWCSVEFEGGTEGNPFNLAHCLFLKGEEVKELVIPEGVTTIGNDAFHDASGLTSVVIPSTVTQIGSEAFAGCSEIKTLSMASGVKVIGGRAFAGCRNLTGVTVPEGTERLGDGAFYHCGKLADIHLPQSLLSIGNFAFEGCDSLTAIVIPDQVTELGGRAFYECGKLASVKLSDNITEIGDLTFTRCYPLKDINLPKNLQRLGDYAFLGCSKIEELTLPCSLIEISKYAFLGCQGLRSLIVEKGNPKYLCEDGVLFDHDMTTLLFFPPHGDMTHYDIPETVTTIVPAAFSGSQLKSITLPPMLTVIGNSAFSGLSKLEYITIPSSVTSIGSAAFSGCTSLKELDIPEGVQSIGTAALSGDSSLVRVHLPKGLTRIEGSLFEGCTNLREVNVPDGIDYIGTQAFYNCRSLPAFQIPQGVTIIDDYAFMGCQTPTELTIPDKVEDVGWDAFSGCSKLEKVTIGRSVKALGGGTFYGCNSIREVWSYIEEPFDVIDYVRDDGWMLIGKCFSDEVTGKAILYVPHGTIEEYRSKRGWRNFVNISDIIQTATEPDDNIAYRPFVEEGKVWKLGSTTGISDGIVKMVEYYYFDGDTIINGKTCKKMMCQRYYGPDYHDDAIHFIVPALRYIGAWYEEDKKVYYYAINNQLKMMYDFSLEANDTLLVDNEYLFVVGPKQTGGLKGFKGVYRDIMWYWSKSGSSNYSTTWLEGVGSIDGPTNNVFYSTVSRTPFLMSCTVGDEVIYLNDEYEDGATPAEARKRRFDFSHTIKTKPKARRQSGEEQSLYGEYNEQQLGINLDPLVDAYQVRITDESGKLVYEKAVNAGSIVGLNIDISAYAKGRYTVTVENSQESFTGQFETQATGIEELKNSRIEELKSIYNLQGQRLNTLQKGLNIVNGRKVYVK